MPYSLSISRIFIHSFGLCVRMCKFLPPNIEPRVEKPTALNSQPIHSNKIYIFFQQKFIVYINFYNWLAFNIISMVHRSPFGKLPVFVVETHSSFSILVKHWQSTFSVYIWWIHIHDLYCHKKNIGEKLKRNWSFFYIRCLILFKFSIFFSKLHIENLFIYSFDRIWILSTNWIGTSIGCWLPFETMLGARKLKFDISNKGT